MINGAYMKITLLVTAVLLLCSCAIPISIESFEKELRKNSSNSSTLSKSKWQNGIFYQGYEGEYHYFYIDPGLGFPKKYKVLRSELEILHQYPYTDNRKAWLPYADVK